jgi:hypothetical protein
MGPKRKETAAASGVRKSARTKAAAVNEVQFQSACYDTLHQHSRRRLSVICLQHVHYFVVFGLKPKKKLGKAEAALEPDDVEAKAKLKDPHSSSEHTDDEDEDTPLQGSLTAGRAHELGHLFSARASREAHDPRYVRTNDTCYITHPAATLHAGFLLRTWIVRLQHLLRGEHHRHLRRTYSHDHAYCMALFWMIPCP